MIRYIAAAAGAMNRHVLRCQDVRFIAASAKRVDMRMFDEEKNVGKGLALLQRDKRLLQLKSRKIFHAAEILVTQHRETRN